MCDQCFVMVLQRNSYRLLLLIISINVFYNCYSQNSYNTIVQGKVTDAKTKEPIPFVSVLLENTTVGTVTDDKGMYRIVTSKTAYRVTFSFLGYEPESRIIAPGRIQNINIELIGSAIKLGEVHVTPKKKYSNKNNPAVELIENVIKNKSLNRKESLDFYNYKKYEKIVFALSNISNRFEQMKLFSKFHFIFDNVDTSRIDEKDDLPLFIKEKESDLYFRKKPESQKEIIKGEKTINFEEYIDSKGLTANIHYLYQDINIYDNEIFFMSNKFLSPIASTAPVLYRYYITDTTTFDSVKCIKLFFEPRNPSDFLFHGFLFITADDKYAIREVDMSFNKKINIDWIKDVRIIQDFNKIDDKAWMLTKDEISVDFGLTQNLPGVLGRRTATYNNISVDKALPDSIFKTADIFREKDAYEKDWRYWESVRNPPLDYAEKKLYGLIDSVKKVPSFRRKMNTVMLLTTNFLNLGKVEIGPDVSFYSYNPVEGSRVRFGGRTTPEFNKNIYLESYLAYGFYDQRLKYNLITTFSLSGTSIYKFPVKSIHLGYRYDTKIPGQQLDFSAPDNIFYSLTRGKNDKMVYNRTIDIGYMNEFENHFSYILGYSYTRQFSAGSLYFSRNDSLPQTNEIPSLRISEPYITLRFAPKEEFYQGKIYRTRVPSPYPIFQITWTLGSKALNNDYNYQKLEFGASKRFYLSIFGYTDVSAQAGKIFGKIPYPYLFIHNANQTFAYQKFSYNMMNFMEFVSDQYVSFQIDHSFNGFFFNKIPLLKKLKLREVVSFKGLFGSVADRNNPHLQSDLFTFPVDKNGIPMTFTLGSTPYFEASVGVSNLLKIFRVDLIKRFTYLGNPNVKQLGVRFQFKFDI